MRWATFRDAVGERVGLVDGDAVHALEPGTRLIDLLGDRGEALGAAAEKARSEEPIGIAEVQLLAPVPRPPSVRDFYAFEQHVKTAKARRGLEMDPDWYKLPVFYFTNPAPSPVRTTTWPSPPALRPSTTSSRSPPSSARAAPISNPAKPKQHIAGFCVMNDWSARDLQIREMRQSLGPAKGKDFATAIGPVLVTPDELEPFRKGRAYDLAMTASVNGKEYCRASLADIYWSFGEMLAYASRGTQSSQATSSARAPVERGASWSSPWSTARTPTPGSSPAMRSPSRWSSSAA